MISKLYVFPSNPFASGLSGMHPASGFRDKGSMSLLNILHTKFCLPVIVLRNNGIAYFSCDRIAIVKGRFFDDKRRSGHGFTDV